MVYPFEPATCARTVGAGESFFQQVLRCTAGAGEATMAPKYLGDINVIDDLSGAPLYMTSGAFLASSDTVCAPNSLPPRSLLHFSLLPSRCSPLAAPLWLLPTPCSLLLLADYFSK
jgi:hypothetical protein